MYYTVVESSIRDYNETNNLMKVYTHSWGKWYIKTVNDIYSFSIKVVPEQSGKVEYERESLLGIAKKLMNFLAIPSKPFALLFDFSALLGHNLN
jgi:hypothetical protein